jgi:hypothetical protein
MKYLGAGPSRLKKRVISIGFAADAMYPGVFGRKRLPQRTLKKPFADTLRLSRAVQHNTKDCCR